jgi:hypothetical protein
VWRDGLDATLYMIVLDSLRSGWVGGGACGPSGPSGASVADGSQRQRRGASWRPRPTAHGWANGRVCQDMRAVVDLAKHGLSCRTRHNRARTQVRVGVTAASHQLSIVGGVVYTGIAQPQGDWHGQPMSMRGGQQQRVGVRVD